MNSPFVAQSVALQRQRSSDQIVADILSTVAREFGMDESSILADTRSYAVFMPRMAAIYFARLLTHCTLIELGQLFGGRSHTTILRAFHRCRDLMAQDEAWAERMDRLRVRLVEKVIVPSS